LIEQHDHLSNTIYQIHFKTNIWLMKVTWLLFFKISNMLAKLAFSRWLQNTQTSLKYFFIYFYCSWTKFLIFIQSSCFIMPACQSCLRHNNFAPLVSLSLHFVLSITLWNLFFSSFIWFNWAWFCLQTFG